MKRFQPNSGKKGPEHNPEEKFERGFRQLDNKEARVFSRVPCSEETHFSANRELFRGTIKNVSQGGIYVQTKERFTVGQEVVVAGPFGKRNEETKKMGKIVWHDREGIAIQFVRHRPAQPRR